MINPIISALGKNNNNIFNLITTLRNGNPDQIAQQMARSNPQFADFMRKNQGKTPEQIAREYGLPSDILKQFIK